MTTPEPNLPCPKCGNEIVECASCYDARRSVPVASEEMFEAAWKEWVKFPSDQVKAGLRAAITAALSGQTAEPVVFKNGPVALGYRDAKHLKWIADRLEHIHGENPNYDYMLKLHEIAAALATSISPAPDAGWREAFDEMVAALTPFAELAVVYDTPDNEWGIIMPHDGREFVEVTIGDLRRARAAISKAQAAGAEK